MAETHHSSFVIRHPSLPHRVEPRDRIIEHLSAASAPISGQLLSHQLGISRTAVFKHIATLRDEGYEIEALKGAGYRLVARTWRLLPREILRHGLGLAHVRQWTYRDAVGSTNDLARELAEASAPSGTVVIAEEQTTGRGRRGRRWVAPPGSSILLSVLLRPPVAPGRIGLYSLSAAEAAARAIGRALGIVARTKWPNDILCAGRLRPRGLKPEGLKTCPTKVGGVLIEMSAQAERIEFIVIGIGINCLQSAQDLSPEALAKGDFPEEIRPESKIQNPKSKMYMAPATSLALEAKGEVDRSLVCAHLLHSLGERFDAEGRIADEADLLRSWRELDVCLGREVTISGAGPTIVGKAVDVDETGALWVQPRSGGPPVPVVAGDVSITQMTNDG